MALGSQSSIQSLLQNWSLAEATKIARIGIRFVRPKILTPNGLGHGSRTLAEAMQILQQQQGLRRHIAGIYIPHFWAVYLHDGRGAVTPKQARVLVWYKDRREDPRLQGGHTPERAHGIPRLTKQQFQRDRLAGRLVVAKKSGPTVGNPFFENSPGGGMYGFARMVGPLIAADFSSLVKSLLSAEGLLRKRAPVRVRLG